MIRDWRKVARRLPLLGRGRPPGPRPRVRRDGSTNVPGLYLAGSLVGATDVESARASGARTAARIADDLATRPVAPGALDLVIVGAGAAGLAAALEAQRRGLDLALLEAVAPLRGGAGSPPGGGTRRRGASAARGDAPAAGSPPRPDPIAEIARQVEEARIRPRLVRVERIERDGGRLRAILAKGEPLAARAVILATSRCGCLRRLGVPGEDLGHVAYRLHDAEGFAGRRVLVVGGGQTAAEAAVALAEGGAGVTLAHRGPLLTRPTYASLSRLSDRLVGAPTVPWRKGVARESVPRRAPGPGTVDLRLMTRVGEIRADEALLEPVDGPPLWLPCDAVLVMIGREPAADFLRRSGVALRSERMARR